jgi:hypothetical protein
MKILHIHTTIDSTKSVLSIGSYWDCSGKHPIETTWEYIGDEMGLTAALAKIRGESDAEFMHVVNRMIAQ